MLLSGAVVRRYFPLNRPTPQRFTNECWGLFFCFVACCYLFFVYAFYLFCFCLCFLCSPFFVCLPDTTCLKQSFRKQVFRETSFSRNNPSLASRFFLASSNKFFEKHVFQETNLPSAQGVFTPKKSRSDFVWRQATGFSRNMFFGKFSVHPENFFHKLLRDAVTFKPYHDIDGKNL